MASISSAGLSRVGFGETARSSNFVPRTLLYWLPIAFVITVLAGLVYLAVQQSFRMGANDPQIQIAEDTAAQWQAGQQPQALVGVTGGKVDIASSLATFTILYDDQSNVIASSAQLHGQTPQLPVGVLQSVRQSGEDRLSWQPESGVRIAAVVTRVNGSTPGFVLAGRSMREVEKRIDDMGLIVGSAWLVGVVGALVLAALVTGLTDRLRA